MKKVLAIVIAMSFLIMALAGCGGDAGGGAPSGGTEPAGGGADPNNLKIAFICKILNDEWFLAEHYAMEATAEKYGIEYVAIDANMNNEKNMQAVENVITEGYDGVIICVTDQGLSMAVANRFKEVGMPVIAIDDALIDENGEDMVPYVGVKTYDFGYEGGQVLAQMALDRDFFADGNTVMVMGGTTSQLQHSAQVVTGHIAALKDELPQLTDDMIMEVDTHTMLFDDAMKAMSAAFNAHPEVTHWIVPCADDPVAYAAFKLFQENNFPGENALLAGYCAYSPTYQILTSGTAFADNYISLALRPDLEGVACIEHMYNFLVNGTPIPPETRYGEGIVNIDNFMEHFEKVSFADLEAMQSELD